MSARTLTVTSTMLGLLLVPTSAAAAMIEPLSPCYVTAGTRLAPQSEAVEVTASGFTANSKVDLAVDGEVMTTGLQTDMTGALDTIETSAPWIRRGRRQFNVTLTEQGNPANFATAVTRTTALRVTVKPRIARPSRVIRFKGSGFTRDKGVFAHYIYKGKVRKNVRMARDPGICGTWVSHRRQIPVADPGTGIWTVQFDQSRKYKRDPVGVRVRISISVSRV